jgi:hypothetical protein
MMTNNSSSPRPNHATQMVETGQVHAEVIDPTNRKVWQSIGVCEAETLASLDLPDPLLPVSVGAGVMDEMWFDRSPGTGVDGPMEERLIDGRRFAQCAAPMSAPAKPFGKDGPTEMFIDKYRVLRFVAGRSLPLPRSPEGDLFVHVIDGTSGATIGLSGDTETGPLVVPEGCALGTVALPVDWIVTLPNPTRVFFFPNRDSFQGPIATLPGKWEPSS